MSVKIKEISTFVATVRKSIQLIFFLSRASLRYSLQYNGTSVFAKRFSLELSKPLKIFLSYLAMHQLKISQYSTRIIEFDLKHSSQFSFTITIQWGPCIVTRLPEHQILFIKWDFLRRKMNTINY